MENNSWYHKDNFFYIYVYILSITSEIHNEFKMNLLRISLFGNIYTIFSSDVYLMYLVRSLFCDL